MHIILGVLDFELLGNISREIAVVMLGMISRVTRFAQEKQISEFFNHWCLAAVLLFALNNHLFKNYYHNWITGKLSDVCFCFFLPLLISAVISFVSRISLVSRVRIGCITTIVIFSAVKISTGASELLNTTLSYLTLNFGLPNSINIVDPTDLLALPMVYVAYQFAKYHVVTIHAK